MANDMPVVVEVWPVAVDAAGIWLVSGTDAWRTDSPVPSDSEPHADVDLVLFRESADDDRVIVHSTSWRVDGPRLVVTYLVVLNAGSAVRARWPKALPVDLELTQAVGRPFTHGPAEPPTPRQIDVLLHALRHLRFLLDTDASTAAVIDETWRVHLGSLRPALAGMYSEEHHAA